MYNVMARSQALVTPLRCLVGTLTSAGVAAAVLGPQAAAAAGAAAVAVSVAAVYYCRAIINGVVGDYIGATICVVEVAVYLVLGADWAALSAPGGWRPLATLAAAMLVPVVWGRRIVEFC
jgi:cobalamin synthase